MAERDRLEAELCAGTGLGDQAHVLTQHRGDLWIATYRWPVGHQHDRLTVRRHLDGAHRYAIGHDLGGPEVIERGAAEAIAHAVGISADLPLGGKETLCRLRREVVILRPQKHAHRAGGARSRTFR